MKTVKELITQFKNTTVIGNDNVVVMHLTYDSRTIGEGSMFFAVKGTQVDGHQFIEDVINKGAAVIVCESLPQKIDETVTYIKVENSTEAMASIAAAFFDHPSKKLKRTRSCRCRPGRRPRRAPCRPNSRWWIRRRTRILPRARATLCARVNGRAGHDEQSPRNRACLRPGACVSGEPVAVHRGPARARHRIPVGRGERSHSDARTARQVAADSERALLRRPHPHPGYAGCRALYHF